MSGSASSPSKAAPIAEPAGPRRSPPAETPGKHRPVPLEAPRSPVARNVAARGPAAPHDVGPPLRPCAPSSRACVSPAAPCGPSSSSRATAPAPRPPRLPPHQQCERTARRPCPPTGTSSGSPWPTCRGWDCPRGPPTQNQSPTCPTRGRRPGDAHSHSR